jgi:hypothetical protein
MKIKKSLAKIALPACILTSSMPTMAATNYTTTNSSSTNVDNPITADKDENKVNVSVAQGSTFSVSIPKTIVLDGSVDKENNSTYNISVSGNIASDEAVIVKPDATFTMSDVKGVKKDLNGTISQTITKFLNKEVSIDSTLKDFQHLGSTTGVVSIEGLTSGSWTGQFNFNIKLHTHDFATTILEKATTTKTGSKQLSCEECGLFLTQTIPQVTIEKKDSFSEYTWDEVQLICQNGLANEYFTVGETRVVELGALPSASNSTKAQNMTLAIGDIAKDGSTMTILVTGYSSLTPKHIINETATTIGGWAATSMRAWLNGEYYNALPDDLQKVITLHSSTYSETYNASTVSTCEDKVWLLSAKEVFGGSTASQAGDSSTNRENLAAFNVETQLAYFANGGSKLRYESEAGSTSCWWWLRSSHYQYDNNFVYVSEYGKSGGNYSSFTDNVFPAFDIG